MKILKRSNLSILTILILTSLSLPNSAQAEQNSIKTFSWEGLSLSMTPDQMVNTLESDGYTQFRIIEGVKKVYIYQKKSETTNNKVQFTEKDGVLTKFSFSQTRIGGKKNKLSDAQTDATYTRVKSGLDIEDSTCRAGIKGGGTCNGAPTSATHINRYNVNVTPKSTKIVLSSNLLSQAVIESNNETTDSLASAYGCLGTADIASVKDIYECIDSVAKALDVLDKAKKINRSKHMPVYLSSPTTPCWQLANFYKRGLSYLKDDADTPLPSCATFAAVIKHAAGSPAFWSGCLNEDVSDEFLKRCVDGVNASYFKLVDQRLPTCREYQTAYQTGVVAAHDTAISISSVPPPECEHVLAFAKSLRKPLTEERLACAGYDPDKAEKHITKCLTSDSDLSRLQTCQHVQLSYRKKLMLSNYGYVPESYVPIACDQTVDLLAKAQAVRERLVAKEIARVKEFKEFKENEKIAYKLKKVKIDEEMALKYADTPQAVASRTSKLEKEIKASGKVEYECKATADNNFYCPPTLEEIRLAMMRYHASLRGLKVINGDMVHGNLNARIGQSAFGSKYLGAELKYGEIIILRSCSRSGEFYDCYFTLDLQHYMDKKTLHLRGYSPNVTTQMQFIKRDYYSYYFWINKDNLWDAKATESQLALDQDFIEWQEKMNQDLMNNSENPWGVDGL